MKRHILARAAKNMASDARKTPAGVPAGVCFQIKLVRADIALIAIRAVLVSVTTTMIAALFP